MSSSALVVGFPMIVEKTKPPRCTTEARSALGFGVASLVPALWLALGAFGCGSGSAESVDAPSAASTPVDTTMSGSVSLALDVGNAHLSSVAYAIVGSEFQQTGTLDVSNATRISAVIGGIPFGTDYVVTLTAASSEPVPMTCDGSAAFQVLNDAPVNLPVHVTCTQQKVMVATTPAPIPHGAGALLGLALLGLGLAFQRRRAA
jgi:hypothetical protein